MAKESKKPKKSVVSPLLTYGALSCKIAENPENWILRTRWTSLTVFSCHVTYAFQSESTFAVTRCTRFGVQFGKIRMMALMTKDCLEN